MKLAIQINRTKEYGKALSTQMRTEASLMFAFFVSLVYPLAVSMPKSYTDLKRIVDNAGRTSGFLSEDRKSHQAFGCNVGQVSVGELMVVAIFIVVIAIVAGMGAKILAGMKVGETEIEVNNTLDKGIAALGTIGDWLDDITTVYVAVVIISLLVGILAVVSLAQMRGGTGTQL